MRRATITILLATVALVASACSGPSANLTIRAKNIAFDPTDLAYPAGSDLTVAFVNDDPEVPHGLGLYGGPGFTTPVVEEPIAPGPVRQTFHIGVLIPGRYQFRCQVHANMVTDLLVGGPT